MKRDLIKNSRLRDAEITIIKDEFKTARNGKGYLHVGNTETEWEDNETFLGFNGEGKAAVLKESKVIVEDVIGNERRETRI